MELYCKRCNHKISESSLVEIEIDQLDMGDGKVLMSKGRYIESEKVDFNFNEQIHFLMNPDGLNVTWHNDSSRLTGCCGPGIFNGLNLICCECSAEVGIVSADCWMPHFVGLSLSAVSKTPVW